MTADQLAEVLGVSRAHIFEQAARGLLPHYRIGRSVRFDLNEVLVAVRERSA